MKDQQNGLDRCLPGCAGAGRQPQGGGATCSTVQAARTEAWTAHVRMLAVCNVPCVHASHEHPAAAGCLQPPMSHIQGQLTPLIRTQTRAPTPLPHALCAAALHSDPAALRCEAGRYCRLACGSPSGAIACQLAASQDLLPSRPLCAGLLARTTAHRLPTGCPGHRPPVLLSS